MEEGTGVWGQSPYDSGMCVIVSFLFSVSAAALFFCVFIVIVLISLNCYAKYVIESNIEVATIKIDGERPIIELVEIENSNNKYPQYASERHTIKAKIKVIEKNIQRNNFDKNRIKIIVGENAIVPQIYQI